MWTLECDGESLAHRKVWLRPGKTYLFGRTIKTPRDAGIRIDHKSVSRQHLTLSVSLVQPGTATSVNSRSEITFKDENTKFKTELDGLKIQNESRTLKKDEHTFRLGNSGQTFRLKWQPIVFTFSFSSKDLKPGRDPLAPYRNRLEELDIKVTTQFIIGVTTHVIAGKRNTAKGLQALVNGQYIVSESFIDALVYAATPSNLDEAESLSPLEEDFEKHWPDALQHLPVRSKEPSERPVEDYAPKPERVTVFEGYTFIFCEAAQFETLQAPITNGGGKALEYKLDPGQTRAEDIVLFVKNAAGEKGLGELEDGSEGKGVVVVKFRGSMGYEDWAAELDHQVAQALDLRLVEQSEFLDAILSNDAAMLRRPLLPNEDDPTASALSASNHVRTAPKVSAQNEVTDTQIKRPRVRQKIEKRFKGFDDDEDDDTTIPAHIPAASKWSQSNGANGETGTNDDISNTRKRPVPSSDPEDEEDLVDKLLPAATALKRRKIENEANGIFTQSFEGSEPQPKSSSVIPKKEVNIKDVVRERRKAEEEAARLDEEALSSTLDGMSVEEMKRLAVVEEMEVPTRRTPTESVNGTNHDRWDERWNGRKNFKKFRRKGDQTQAVRRAPAVMVPLEEAKTKDFGIGQAYWQEDNERTKRDKSKQRRASPSQSQHTQYNSARSQLHTAEIPSELVESSETAPEVIDVDAPRTTRGQDRTQQTDHNSSGPKSEVTVANGKRPAHAPAGPPLVKRRKKFAAARDSDEDD